MESLTDPRISNPVLSSLKIKTQDKIIFIRENSFADSNFIITHLLKQLLFEKSRICFLTLHNTFDHYHNVGQKLGYNLQQMVGKGTVKIIDPLDKFVESIGQLNDDIEHSRLQILNLSLESIKAEIYAWLSIQKCSIYLIIDDLSHFLDLGIELSAVIDFTSRCLDLTSDENVFAVINSHVGSLKSDLIVANNIQYVCDVYVCVSQLKTGKSHDITGLMTVRRGQHESRFHFRAFDRGVRTFNPGETVYNLYK